MRMQGRKVLITGGASGIGLASARRFVAEGARVALLDRDAEGLATAARELGDAAISLRADVTIEAEVQKAVNEAAASLGGLDGLVNAAGISIWRAFSVQESLLNF